MPQVKQFTVGLKNKVTAAVGDNVLELCFYDTIQNPEYFDWSTMQIEEGNLVADIINQVKAYNPSKIRIEIDCMGGELGKAIAIYNFLKDFPAKVEVQIMGFCASAATVVACAASPGKLIMPANGFFITHASSMWEVGGTSKDLREAADVNDRYTQTMAEILAARNTKGHTAEELIALWGNGDCWMDGQEAKEYGFVDDYYNKAVIVTARIDEAKAKFRNAPSNITASVEEEDTDNASFLSKIEKSMKNFGELVTAALGKLGTSKITAKVTDANGSVDITEQVTAAIQPVIADLAANMQTEVTAELETIKTSVTESVTAAMEQKYGTTITTLQNDNAALKKTIEDLEADVTAKIAGETGTGKVTGNADQPKGWGRGVGGSK